MTNRWPAMPKHLMAKIYANHRRRQPVSKGPYAITRTRADSMRITDEENGTVTEWRIKRLVTGVRFVCVADLPPLKASDASH